MNGIFWGILLQSLSLNVLYLNYILPAAGAMVLYLHLRKFSQVNEAFRKAFRFSAALVLYQILSLVSVRQDWRAVTPHCWFLYL